ncbi:MAG: SMC-Scp complex subunit ScpB [Capsulimonadales bacterium]|nr:SMC-Scp complex subunit ScpB [Capsulimonadales bacterium]
MNGTETDGAELTAILECLLFVAGEPLAPAELAKLTGTSEERLVEALTALRERYRLAGSGLQLIEIAGGWQMGTRPEFASLIGRFLAPNANRLSRPALETVTIIAYRQPCTQAEIEAIRGVAVDGVLKTLVERELIREAGRKPSPGRPILYATTEAFLHYFGLASLAQLPVPEEDDPPENREEAMRTALVAAGAA